MLAQVPARTTAAKGELWPVLSRQSGGRPLGYYEPCLLFLSAYHDLGVSKASILAESTGVEADLDIPALVASVESYGLTAALQPLSLGRISGALLPAYDFALYGSLDAHLVNIGADAKPLPVIPGMMAEVDVLAGQRTILDYILKPVVKVREKAFRE